MHLLVSNFVSVEKFDIYILGDCTFNSRRPELYTISFFVFFYFFFDFYFLKFQNTTKTIVFLIETTEQLSNTQK